MNDKPDRRTPKVIAAVGVVALLLGVLVVLNHGDGDSRSARTYTGPKLPIETPQEKAAAGAVAEHGTAEARIASLSFKCIERYVCHVYPLGRPLPLFIDGMDERLVAYLEEHGYTDSWHDNAGAVHGQAIGPDRNTADGQAELDHYVASYRYGTELPIGTGLIYEPPEDIVGQASGPYLQSRPPGKLWKITWQLKDQSGEMARELAFSIPVKNCEYEGTTGYCSKVSHYELDEANNGQTNSNEYSAAFYQKPPLFQY